uniref:Uncharacterized protein n=1 Tax=Panagrolaimus sp. JU765 TaxID=591449 RepID=A0AC34Q1G9_9BILA
MSLKVSNDAETHRRSPSTRHRPISRLFSGVNQGSSREVSRKSSVPSAVLFSAPLIGATVGDKFGEQVCEFTFFYFSKKLQIQVNIFSKQ